jgi:beta-barrel assembly-enhancing protease
LPRIGQEEIKMGDEAAKTAEKDLKILDDPILNARVHKIGEALAASANSAETTATYGTSQVTQFTYTFKVIDGKDVNAFSIPGGHVYIYKGLIDFCESDHELAAVMAHEIAHISHHHMVYLMKEESKLDGKLALLLVAGLLGNMRAEDMSNVMMGTEFYKVAKVNSYGQKAESDADIAGLSYMTQAHYNPVGMLTFLEKLADHPEEMNLGILQTHPLASDRVAAVKGHLLETGVTINRRDVTTSYTAKVCRCETAGVVSFDVKVGDRQVCKLFDEEHAKRITDRINGSLDHGLQIRDIKVCDSSVTANGQPIIDINDGDAALAGKPAGQLAVTAGDALRRVVFAEMIRDIW